MVNELERILTEETYPLLKDMIYNYDMRQSAKLKELVTKYKGNLEQEKFASYILQICNGLSVVYWDSKAHHKTEKTADTLKTMSEILNIYYSSISLEPFLLYKQLTDNLRTGIDSIWRNAPKFEMSAEDTKEYFESKNKQVEDTQKMIDSASKIGIQPIKVKSFYDWFEVNKNK